MQEYNGFTEKERLKGDRIIKNAIKNGEILPLTQAKCCVCGQDKGIIQYHCEDYTPENILDDIAPICWHCHQQLHRNRANNPEKWKQYLKDVKNGILKKPVYNKIIGLKSMTMKLNARFIVKWLGFKIFLKKWMNYKII